MPGLFLCLPLLAFTHSWALEGCPPAKHEIDSLPGYGKPPSRWASGFIDAGLLAGKEHLGHMCFHYTYIESMGDPATDPVFIWYQGGPGAPGLFGLFLEFGPLLLNADSLIGINDTTGIPKPVWNPYTWALHANLLIMDNAPPIGFSFCSAIGPKATASQCGAWTDTSTFAANHKALTTFFNTVMPELRGNDVFIYGESYGGVYVPGISATLIDDPQGVNLKGFVVVSGCMGTDVLCIEMGATAPHYPNVYAGPWYDVLFFHGHGQISNELFARIMSTCTTAELKGEIRPLVAPCQAIIDEMWTVLGGFWTYNIQDECSWDWLSVGPKDKSRYAYHANGYACSSPAHEIWLARSEVRTAMGLPIDSNYILVDNGAGFSYASDVADVRPLWLKALKAGVRVMAMAGDLDANVNMFATQDIFVNMWNQAGYTQTQAWRPWTLDGRKHMGGYVIQWAGGNASYVTFRGSGHMIPEYKANASSAMLKHWIAGKDLPHYEAKHATQKVSSHPAMLVM